MNKIIVGTRNEAKVKQIRGALSSLRYEIEGLPTNIKLPDVIEDGTTPQENARKKVMAYSRILDGVVMSMDNALYLDDLPDDQQPGMNVRKINGRVDRPTDQELLDHYIRVVKTLGARVNGRWEFAICIAKAGTILGETTIMSPRVFIPSPSSKMVPGYPLESIQIDPGSGKYISEMTPEESDQFWQKMIGGPLCTFVSGILG